MIKHEDCSIPIVIPSLDPDEKLLQLLQQLTNAGLQRIVLVNDGSAPQFDPIFAQAQRQFGCVVLRHATNLGKGRALKTAFQHCLAHYPDAVGCVTADSDGQHTPACIAATMQALAQNPSALVLGVRNFDAAGVPPRSRWGNKFTRLVFRLLVGLSITDTQTGLRGISASYMQALLQTGGDRFEFESNMLIDTKQHHVPIVEVPIETVYLQQNASSHFHPLRDSARVYAVFGRFLFSSLSSSLLDLGLFALFCWLFAGLVPSVALVMLATVLARIISAVYNYSINYAVVFHSTASRGSSALRYFLLALVQMGASALLVGGLFWLFQGGKLLIKICVDVCLFFVSFQLQREFVYRQKAKDKPANAG